ncbi:MAG: hypothetical protein Q4E57_02785 [Eubacteriales bacterium]|nr:hypothetical protein [Eubacteriales bacterium]
MQTLIDIMTNDVNVSMQYEIALMLCAFFVSALVFKDRKRLRVVWGSIFLFFIYIHRILLPFIISGVYLLIVSGLVTALVKLDIHSFFLPAKAFAKKLKRYTETNSVLPFTAVILTILLIQLCRINIAMDYDSLRYGLRSDVLLTNGRGIAGFFANTGLVNSVYSYPKGFELLTRPLYFGGTYGNVLCVNIWAVIAVILLTGEIVYATAGSEEAEVLAAMLTSLVPGITNMSITAKSDLVTLICQLTFIYCIVRYAGGNERQEMGGSAETGIGTGALLLSYAFKPTAVAFSSIAGITAIIYFLSKKISIRFNASGIRALILSVIYSGIITVRTFIITGQPFAGVFTGLFESLGLKLKYPFRSQSMVYSDDSVGFSYKLKAFISRLFHFMCCPVGDDMSHVIIAWGGLVFLLMLIAVIIFIRGTSQRMGELNRLSAVEKLGLHFNEEAFDFLKFITAAAGGISLISLALLYQVDGNYFMLIYSLTAALGTIVLFTEARYEMSGLGKNFRSYVSGGSNAALILLSAVMIYFTAFTNWSGPVGFTPADLVNKGYYDHEAEYMFDTRVWDKNARVVAFAKEPDCYRIKGRVESWVDIDGSGGNVYLTDTKLNIFKDYLEFADIDYIYADLDFISDKLNSRHERAGVLFTYLLEDGCFEDVFLLEGSSDRICARLDKARTAVDWETPMSKELISRIEEQKSWFDGIR